MDIHVVGGCYREVCHWPSSDEVYGSGGRAAEVIAQLSQREGTHLHSVLEAGLQGRLKSNLALLSCELHLDATDQTPIFEYDHPLARPEIYPSRIDLSQAKKQQIAVEADNALIFGMLEADVQVQAKKAVYDPQNAVSPEPFSSTANRAVSLALVLNRAEALSFYQQLVGSPAPVDIETEALADVLLSAEKACVVVIKCGQRGAFVLPRDDQSLWVPAYKTRNVYPIGSGDCFAAAFAYYWMVEALNAVDAANHASAVAAFYCDNRTYPDAKSVTKLLEEYQPLSSNGNLDKQVYLAGPFFNLKEMWLINQARQAFKNAGVGVFSPYHDVGPGPAEAVVHQDIEAIERCDVFYALFDDGDPGTLFEIGYAIKCGKPVVIYAETATEEQLKMYEGTGCQIYSDFSTSIYQACWSLNA